MKFKYKQLDIILARLRSTVAGYSDDRDFEVDITLTQADPGNGVMVDCATISATRLPPIKSGEDQEESETKVTIEVFGANEGLEPRAVKTETFKVRKKY